MNKISKKRQQFNNTTFVCAVITQTFFGFISQNRKNIFKTYAFIGEMTEVFLEHCKIHKYKLGENVANDKEGIINWCKDCLREHPSFKDPEPLQPSDENQSQYSEPGPPDPEKNESND